MVDLRGTYGRFARQVLALLVLLTFVAVAGCSKEAPPEPTPTPEPQKIYWPLTGVETKTLEKRPAVAVKIENDPLARPQTGLEDADIVWETMVEGGVTRFISVYNSKMPEYVGPVRSLRIADGPIVSPMKGLLVFSGSNGHRFQDVANAAGVQLISEDEGGVGFQRIGYNSPHNDFFTLSDALKAAEKDRATPPPAQFLYAKKDDEKPTASEYGKTLENEFVQVMSSSYITSWKWDAASKTFLRFQDGEPFMSAAGTQISAKNVIALEMDTSGCPEVDPSGTPEMDMHVVGKGKGYIATDGKYLPITWSKESDTAMLKITAKVEIVQPTPSPSPNPTPNETISTPTPTPAPEKKTIEVQLTPGNTWIMLVPNGTGEIRH
ncbi:MAG: DUF3048 domain-containing protein [Bifidobacteriaceae bacterium]|jgi:hypothetical protein|nr:DUF3048 domain-containing protein [Bifidobacteriaceae bacterium]